MVHTVLEYSVFSISGNIDRETELSIDRPLVQCVIVGKYVYTCNMYVGKKTEIKV